MAEIQKNVYSKGQLFTQKGGHFLIRSIALIHHKSITRPTYMKTMSNLSQTLFKLMRASWII